MLFAILYLMKQTDNEAEPLKLIADLGDNRIECDPVLEILRRIEKARQSSLPTTCEVPALN